MERKYGSRGYMDNQRTGGESEREKPREKPLLIRFQRNGKFASSAGSDQIACKWSGRTQIAMVSNGYRR